MLPHLAMNCGRCSAAIAVIRAASRQLVWSFQSHAIAAGLVANFFFAASVQAADFSARFEETEPDEDPLPPDLVIIRLEPGAVRAWDYVDEF